MLRRLGSARRRGSAYWRYVVTGTAMTEAVCMSKRASLRATRPSGIASQQVDRGAPLSDRQSVAYWCRSSHVTKAVLAADVEPPEVWDCGTCGAPAAASADGPGPAIRQPVFFRTPFEFLMMRRTEKEGEALLAEAMAELNARRKRGELPR
jgi:hypothetical protein